MTRLVREAIGSAFPSVSVASIERPAEGNRKETAFVTLADGRRVVVQLSDDPVALRTETRLTREVADRTTVPVVNVVADGVLEGRGYRVTERVEGENLHERFVSLSDGARRRIAGRFGEVLGELHDAFEFERFGPIVAADDGLRATGPAVFGAWLDRYTEQGVEALPDAVADLEGPIREAVGSSPARSPTPRLFPWDLRPGNAVVDGGEIAAFLDWGEPLSGSAGVALAKLDHLVADWYLEDGSELRTAIRDGYREARPIPDIGRGERVAAIVEAVVDSDGAVTRPGYPERTGGEAVAFHRERLVSAL